MHVDAAQLECLHVGATQFVVVIDESHQGRRPVAGSRFEHCGHGRLGLGVFQVSGV
ncbi:hypothetical protein QGN06_16860 [Achromobacter xylosoxidans]|uniref:hypothetical protein n=1 Tax=Alcaligenes xylosoxydans xylosoxydans TaxID=85698 RepID=UPI003F5D6996